LSKSGNLYAMSSSRAAQASSKQYKQELSWWSSMFGTDPGVDFYELQVEGGLKRGEKWASVSAGLHHLLAVTTKGRTFSLPIDPLANSHRQLGVRQFPSTASSSTIDPASDPRAYPTMTEIPALSSVPIEAVTASAFSSFARTPTGRVLGWGANESGQIGLGPSGAIEIVTTPVEIVLARNYPGGTSMKCTNVVAAGALTMFVVERDVPGKEGTWVDLLACGNGMSGGLGNGLWSSACTSPVKVKTVSGLQECTSPLSGMHQAADRQIPRS
jgi:alpha-tubulin suppressor-like RCC1 family protein